MTRVIRKYVKLKIGFKS